MRIAVIGSGAIGTLVSGYLTEKGVDVTLVGKAKDVTAISANGLLIDGVSGEMTVPVRAVEKLEDKADLVILAVKTQDIAPTLSQNLEALIVQWTFAEKVQLFATRENPSKHNYGIVKDTGYLRDASV